MMYRIAIILYMTLSGSLLAEEVKNCNPGTGHVDSLCSAEPSSTWWKCEGWPPEDRQQITAEEKHRLETFALEIFSPKLPGYGPGYSSAIPRNVLIKRFGQPLSTKSIERNAYDPGDPMEIVTTWEYPGFRITTIASKPKPDMLGIEWGQIFGANVSLRYGVRIGQPIDRWVKQFGQPKCSEGHSANEKEIHLVYEQEGELFIPSIEDKSMSLLETYQIDLFLDGSGKVKRLSWSHPMM
jgi:hypothetical protein